MSWTLFKANIRTNRTLWIIMTLVFFMYLSIIISMFDPAGADALQQMLDTLPESIVKAMGFANMGTTLLEFVASYLYGFLVFLVPMVISIVVNHNLIASHIDRGSMAYLLATPNSRRKIAVTQALFSLVSSTLFFVLITGFGIMISHVLFPGLLDVLGFVLLNVYALIVYYAVGGIGFFASCIASESKHSLSIGIGLPVAFIVLKLLGDAGDKFSWVGNLSLYALFDPAKLFEGAAFAYVGMFVLALTGLVLYVGGVMYFNRRDLHV
jgi:ABC-2 type transport system permease protein